MEPPSLAVVQCPPTPASPAPVSAAATSLAPGFRFHPTDQELVSYYLKRKVCGKRIRFDAISETDIYKSEPWDLPALSRLQSKDNEWYFFGVQDRKYVNGSRVNRATGKGYWKATGNDRPIVHNSKTVGMKKTLVFYSGRAPCGKRTNWVMHEYRLTDEEIAKDGISLDSYLLCKILKKSGPGFKPGEQYGPFIEEEWDREDAAFIPGVETEEEVNGDDDARIEDSTTHCFTASESQLLSPPPPPPPPLPLGATVDPSIDTKGILPPCKVNTELGRLTRDGSPEPFPVVPSNKRLKCDPELSLSSEISATAITTNGSCSSSTATALTTSTTTTTNTGLSLEFRLLESVGQKEEDAGGNGCDAAADGSRHFETHNRHMPMPINIMDVNVPPSYLKLFEDLRNEIYKISIEKESLKIEVMSARTMINILQSKVDHLTKVNEDLKRLTTREAL